MESYWNRAPTKRTIPPPRPMARGDHVRVSRGTYWHHAIDCGDGTVIHYTGELKNWRDAAVRRTPVGDFAKGAAVECVPYRRSSPPDRVMLRAESRLGEARYSMLRNNCEHFARWCKTGNAASYQIRQAVLTGAAAATVVAATLAAIVIPARRKPPDA